MKQKATFQVLEQAQITLLNSIISGDHIDVNTLVQLCDDNNFSDSLISALIGGIDEERLEWIRQENNGE